MTSQAQGLETYRFAGSGSYSNHFEWDTGLECTLQNKSSFEVARRDEMNACKDSHLSEPTLPTFPVVGVYPHHINERGGSRQIEGFVIAEDEESALLLINQYERTFPVRDYDGNPYM